MKTNALVMALGLGMGCVMMQSCNQSNNQQSPQMDARTSMMQFLSSFGETTAYAMVDMGETPVLLLSDEIYTNGEAQETGMNALAAQVYVLDASGKVECLGELRSQGTAYPLSTDGQVLMTAGHRYVNCYAVEGEPLDLCLVECVQGEVQAPDVVTYNYENRVTEEYENQQDETRFEQMISRFEAAKPIVFKPCGSAEPIAKKHVHRGGGGSRRMAFRRR